MKPDEFNPFVAVVSSVTIGTESLWGHGALATTVSLHVFYKTGQFDLPRDAADEPADFDDSSRK